MLQRKGSSITFKNLDYGQSKMESKYLGRNINNLKYADDTTLIAKSQEELKSLLMKVKESEKADLKINIQKTNIMASSPITSWQIDGETMKPVTDFTFLGSKITADSDCSHEIKRQGYGEKGTQYTVGVNVGCCIHSGKLYGGLSKY